MFLCIISRAILNTTSDTCENFTREIQHCEINTKVGNVSPSILIPFYDEDSSTLFLAGKGENVINAYEVENNCLVGDHGQIDDDSLLSNGHLLNF